MSWIRGSKHPSSLLKTFLMPPSHQEWCCQVRRHAIIRRRTSTKVASRQANLLFHRIHLHKRTPVKVLLLAPSLTTAAAKKEKGHRGVAAKVLGRLPQVPWTPLSPVLGAQVSTYAEELGLHPLRRWSADRITRCPGHSGSMVQQTTP